MTERNDGGPAFASSMQSGMSLRDYFAGQAMAVRFVELAEVAQREGEGDKVLEGFAVASYEIADAMLEARK